MYWSFDEYYGSRTDACLAFAKLLHEEAVALEAAGAKYVQVDEPALSTRFDELPLLVKAVGIVTKGLRARSFRSEERRVGKECRSRGWPWDEEEKGRGSCGKGE